jgi:hypothetical protein
MFALACLALFSSQVAASMPSDLLPLRARGGELYASLVAEEKAHDQLHGILRNNTPNFFDQLIWHNDSSRGTFKQRYFIDYSFWNGSGPIFLNIGGEGPAGSSPGGFYRHIR